MAEKKKLKKVSMEELDEIGGGLIVEYDGVYYPFSNDGTAFAAVGYRDVGDAVDKARVMGWNTKILNKEQFEAQFGKWEPWGRIE